MVIICMLLFFFISKSVIFIDEIDGLIDEGTASGGGGTSLLAQFNNEMAGLGNFFFIFLF